MQVYFLSTADQFARRRSIFEGLSPDLIQMLTDIMNEFNPYVVQFKSAVSTIRSSVTPNLKVNDAKIICNLRHDVNLIRINTI